MGITAGPDGKVWFTEYSGPDVGKMPPCGCGTDYALSSDYLPEFITLGPDGNLWFSERNQSTTRPGNAIGVTTPTGGIAHTTYDLAHNSFYGQGGIITGPDNNLWFTAVKSVPSGPPFVSEVGKMTTTGAVTDSDSFSKPQCASLPASAGGSR
jgi:streptogramin lyase